MARYFQVFDKELKDLQKLCKKEVPKELRRTTAQILNNVAFTARTEALATLKTRLSIKQEKFIASVLRVEKTKPFIPVNKQRARFGAVKRARFSGFIEQQTGERTERTRIGSLFSRNRDPLKPIRPMYRLKKTFPQPSEYTGKSTEQRTAAMLRQLLKEGYKKPFIIKRHRKFPAGLYKFIRKKVKLLQFLNPRHLQPRRYPWLTIARRRAMRKADISGMFSKSMKHLFRKL